MDKEWGPWLSAEQKPNTGEYVQIVTDDVLESLEQVHEGIIYFKGDDYGFVGKTIRIRSLTSHVVKWRRLVLKEYNPPLKHQQDANS
jgi:hypothetical protein